MYDDTLGKIIIKCFQTSSGSLGPVVSFLEALFASNTFVSTVPNQLKIPKHLWKSSNQGFLLPLINRTSGGLSDVL